jgi:spermidine synthase
MPFESSVWIEELYEMENGRTMKLKVTDKLATYDSKFQRIEIYDTKAFGRMLVLDGVFMTTEVDEMGYHEMLVHVPMCVHPNPKRVLVIGGGDGGTLREVLKHKEVEKADICEIDGDVIRLCREYMPALSCSFDDPRVTVYTEDGAKFIAERKKAYDIILVDSSDPIGPAAVLFSEEFYKNLSECLDDDGIASTQSESMFYHPNVIITLAQYNKKFFKVPSYYFTMVPTYPSGMIGFSFCSKKYHPIKDLKEEKAKALTKQLRYYNPDIHRGAFALPQFIRTKLEGILY